MAGNRPSRAEAREQRRLEKQAREEQKNIGFARGIQIEDAPLRSEDIPELIRVPRSPLDADAYRGYAFSWGLEHSDRKETWSWGEPRDWTEEEHNQTVCPHLDSYTNNTWTQVEVMTYNGADRRRKRLNKYQDLETLCDEAQGRWLSNEALRQFDSLFRLRVDSFKRLWGVRVRHYFFLVWYDRNHSICPPDND